MIFRLLLPIALALLSGCSFDSAAAAPANCTLQYLAGKAPLIPEKQRSKSRAICYSSFAAQIGRASCRVRVCQYVDISVVAASLNKKTDLPVTNDLISHSNPTT